MIIKNLDNASMAAYQHGLATRICLKALLFSDSHPVTHDFYSPCRHATQGFRIVMFGFCTWHLAEVRISETACALYLPACCSCWARWPNGTSLTPFESLLVFCKIRNQQRSRRKEKMYCESLVILVYVYIYSTFLIIHVMCIYIWMYVYV